MAHVELQVTVHEEDGMYWAEVPNHPGLFASGETMDELLEALGEAWSLYNSDADEGTPRLGQARPPGRSPPSRYRSECPHSADSGWLHDTLRDRGGHQPHERGHRRLRASRCSRYWSHG